VCRSRRRAVVAVVVVAVAVFVIVVVVVVARYKIQLHKNLSESRMRKSDSGVREWWGTRFCQLTMLTAYRPDVTLG
jgi:hypothetical protein